MIRLSNEEIWELLGIDFKTAYSGHVAEYQGVAKAQLKKVLNYAQTHNPDCLIPTLLEETK